MQKEILRSFVAYLKLERSLAAHSIVAYQSDISKLVEFIYMLGPTLSITALTTEQVRKF